ncbi:MAG: SIR2 family protein [Mucilaginibacter sp.]|uniref:SIR2 family protein n=1 Tax=Mucilaginibacter sp. TaxID=1882438 RepID=UPI0031A1C5D9
MTLDEFINYYSLNAPQIMWLLGAGASRSAGMPSATDIIWDLKRRHYCQLEQQHISDNELSNDAVRAKIQNYLEANGCPPMWAEDEYAFYFKLIFGDNLQLQQNYIAECLDPVKVSINSGHRVLASLIALEKARIIFTTNFDNVLENAYSLIEGKDLHSFALDGSVAALEALNNERYPIYAKMHGDFRYTEMKNLPEQLKENDKEIEKCFVNACSRYGIIVSGYSGRDENVMKAFDLALNNPNAFPKGLYWVTSVQGNVYPAVTNLIEKAKSLGITAHIIEAETFDSLLGRIWRVIGYGHQKYDEKIRRSLYEIPKIPKYSIKGGYPLIRTNAFPVQKMPTECLNISLKKVLTNTEFKEKMTKAHSAAIVVKAKTVLAWGSMEEIHKILPENEIKSAKTIDLESYMSNYKSNTQLITFYSRAIARAVINNKPLKLRKSRGRYYAVIQAKDEAFKIYDPLLKEALKQYDYKEKKELPAASLAGIVPRIDNTYWMECVELSLEFLDGKFWLVIVPDVWIEPSENRKKATDFLKSKKKARYNTTQSRLLDVWSKIIFGDGEIATLSPFEQGSENNPEFKIYNKTSFSYKSNQ